ncbi:MAG: gamma carbonic anhydrase family protein, partial [Candidatus Nanohaloarchaea archaeon]|nr:gamma carbonic anhydrase family protein [Candidatus Nanohaloarchaea archaeon]
MEYTLGDDEPATSAAYVFPSATVIGDVTLAEEVSVWPGASLRADANRIRIGEGSNVQDNAVIHVSEDNPALIGAG